MTTYRATLLAAAAALWILPACQPSDDGGGDPDALLSAYEEALEAVETAASDHAAEVAAAADEGALFAEEAAFSADAAPAFEEAVHAALELTHCTGTDAEADPDGVHMMMEEMQAEFAGHEDAMTGAAEADRPGVEDAFQGVVGEHHDHGHDLLTHMHEHADAGELECEEHAD